MKIEQLQIFIAPGNRFLGRGVLLAILVFGCIAVFTACGPKRAPSSRSTDATWRKQKASQKPYTVLGRRYEPLASHEGFEQTGIASWYGPDFHGKSTSNGETYDMHALTAAHKTLPLGVFVRVRNTDNDREIVVRVNDRGPFVKGRIIDLSYAAAKKLGVDLVGTAPVRIEALGYGGTEPGRYKPVPDYDAGTFTVQIGSFRDRGNAERLSADMKKRFGHAEIQMAEISGETYYRVHVGQYSSLRAAEAAERDFVDLGHPGSFTVAVEKR
jgi:rare lipoprotein A